MATCSIFDKIVINNPHFLEEYVDHMDKADGTYEWKRLGNADIKIDTPEDIDKFWQIHRTKKESAK